MMEAMGVMRDRLLAAIKREPLRLEDKRPKQSIKRTEIRVPVGYVLPLGETVKDPFKLIVEAGVRWHPEWDEPRVTVNGWRVFPFGDALCWSGMDLVEDFGALLPNEAIALGDLHGKPLDNEARKLLDVYRLAAPTERQSAMSFIIPERLGKRVH